MRTTSPLFFFFNDTATTEIYTLSLHDALPICYQRCRIRRTGPLRCKPRRNPSVDHEPRGRLGQTRHHRELDRKSTRLNSSHLVISYAVFCLKKKKTNTA